MNVSVVVIGRDAEARLGDALDSVAAVADEIVYVDTGSADGSLDTARRRGATTAEFAWRDDFSAARNFAIGLARLPWILAVDTDEVLLDAARAAAIVARATADPAYPAYLVLQDNIRPDGSVSPNPVARLFRNDPRIRYRNPVHECVSESVTAHWPGVGIPALDVHLRHAGYLPGNAAGKRARNLALLARWAAAEPGHPFCRFKLGTALLEEGDAAGALPHLRAAFERFAADRLERERAPYLRAFAAVYDRCLRAAGLAEEAERFDRTVEGWAADGCGWLA